MEEAEAPTLMKPYDSDIPEGHAFAETRAGNKIDKTLRAHGFSIFARPKEGQPIWIREGKKYTELEALRCSIKS